MSVPMNLRFVRFTVTPDRIAGFRELYDRSILPALHETRGCLWGGLLQDTAKPETCLSMTIWESVAHAEAYADSGLFDRLLDETDDALGEGQVPLSERAPLQDPAVESLSIRFDRDSSTPDEAGAGAPFVRLVALHVELGRTDEFRKRYVEVVAPGLLAMQGCRSVLLAEADHASPSYLSLTIWKSEEDAIRYEASGRFDQLTAAIREFLSGMYQWRISLAAAEPRKIEARDLQVHGFHVVTGGKLR